MVGEIATVGVGVGVGRFVVVGVGVGATGHEQVEANWRARVAF